MSNRLLGICIALLFSAAAARAQFSTPIISGGLQFVSSTNGGTTVYQPVLMPVLAAPLGEHWLVEARADVQGFIAPENGTSGPYQGRFITTLDYLQLDYLANSHLTVSVGRFLTPFNVYDERSTAVWLRNLQDAPLIFPIGTRTSGSSNGVMLRGVAVSHKTWEVNYAAYFSVLSTADKLEAGRAAGGRVGLFLPAPRLELGVSYQRFLQDVHVNSVGTYWSWQPNRVPLDLRGEYAHSPNGSGYWLEGAYAFSRSRGDHSALGNLQAIARIQQFYRGTPSPTASVPGVDTQRFDFGLNYFLPHNVRLNGSYGRQFSERGNFNVWNAQITYRFLFPLIPGGGH
jgi:hypothetical protein